MQENIDVKIRELEYRIGQLPKGSISYKKIRGKEQLYLQWGENGKVRSKYVRKAEVEIVEKQVQERKKLQAQLKELREELKAKGIKKEVSESVELFQTNVLVGDALLALADGVRGWEKRDCFQTLWEYLNSNRSDRVCLLYGLRRTGKTTLLRQAVLEMGTEQRRKTAYIKLRTKDSLGELNHDLKMLSEQGYKYVFLDEVTLMEDFIDGAALLSDIYAAMGMKIVLSGTDSLGFWFALEQELYDRALSIHTTFIPFREHSRLLGINSIDEFIRYGGTLRGGELDFDSQEVNAEDASFRDDESTRRYIDTAICRNIQHSLACYEDGGHFRHLKELYEAGELTGAINRIIENMNHEFLVRVLTEDFKSHDLGSAAQLLRKERESAKRTDVLDRIDKGAVTRRLMEILEIRNRENQSVGITPVHVAEIKEYLKALDLIVECPIETTVSGAEPIERVLFTQPGMRYCQAQALVWALMKDAEFSQASEREKRLVAERILEDVCGRLMEEIVLLETLKAKAIKAQKDRGKRQKEKVCKLQFARGEFDMVVYDDETGECCVYEVKHSKEVVSEQYRHLVDEEKCKLTEMRFGKIVGKYVLYRGEEREVGEIRYRNVEEYLKKVSMKLPTATISKRTLEMMDEAVGNFKVGKVSEPIDLSDFD